MSIRFETVGRAGVITIDRQKTKNSIDLDTDLAFRALWPKINAMQDVDAVILTGAGDESFCVGADLVTFLPVLRERSMNETDDGDFCGMTRQWPTTKPLIAAINGYALAGGLELALACDIRIAAEHATFGIPEVRWGVLAGAGGVTKLCRTVSQSLAMEMIATGRAIDAQRALQAGLVSSVTPKADLMATALKLAETISGNSPVAVRASIHVARHTAGIELGAALATERIAMRRALLSNDFSEGISAFAEKRKPKFKGN